MACEQLSIPLSFILSADVLLLSCRKLQQSLRLLHVSRCTRICPSSLRAGPWCPALVGLLAAVGCVQQLGWEFCALEAQHDRPGLCIQVSLCAHKYVCVGFDLKLRQHFAASLFAQRGHLVSNAAHSAMLAIQCLSQ